MRSHASTLAAVIGVLALVASCSARTYTGTVNVADKNAVYFIGKFCFNPVQGGRIKVNAQGNPTSSFVLMDDQPEAWPSVTSAAVRAASVLSTSDRSRCNAFFTTNSASEFNGTLPLNTVVSISENFRRNWFFTLVNCADGDALAVTSYSVSVTQGDGNPLSCEQIGKFELFATYFAFSFVAIAGLLAFARKIGVPIFSVSSPHALVLYALIAFLLGLIFVLADADSQRATGDLVTSAPVLPTATFCNVFTRFPRDGRTSACSCCKWPTGCCWRSPSPFAPAWPPSLSSKMRLTSSSSSSAPSA
jgi:hypothetical protein